MVLELVCKERGSKMNDIRVFDTGNAPEAVVDVVHVNWFYNNIYNRVYHTVGLPLTSDLHECTDNAQNRM